MKLLEKLSLNPRAIREDSLVRRVVGCTAITAVAAAATALLSPLLPAVVVASGITMIAGGALGWCLDTGAGSERRGLRGIAMGVASGGVFAAFYASDPVLAAGLSGALLGAVLAPLGRDRMQRTSYVAAGATAGMMALTVGERFASSAYLHGALPELGVAAVAGAAAGFFLGMGAMPAHFTFGRDQVARHASRLARGLELQYRAYLEKGLETYLRVADDVKRFRPQSEEDLENLRESFGAFVLKIGELSRRWQEIEAFRDRFDPEGYRARMQEIEAKMVNAQDPYTRQQYRLTLESLQKMANSYEEVGQERERVRALLDRYVTAMEDMAFAFVNLFSTGAHRVSEEITPLYGRMRAYTEELDQSGRALREIALQDIALHS